ncbi:sulfotransferase 6B1 isoform X2 [Ambystoma mexicanum]|uniref:sulfotransferase 6B1 isoform X2 n=1 Tax=Ambystoma mexicanum TaxID=8296 RepID=UPI0037E76E39
MEENPRERMADAALSSELLFTYRGALYPKMRCSPETFQVLENFVARRDDVMLVSYPKCGTNWCVQILSDLAATVSSSKDVKPVFDILEFGASEKYKIMESSPSPRVYATHFHYDNLPKSVFQSGTKKLVILRNPKDSAVSLYHFHNKNPALPNYSDWNDFFKDFMCGKVVWGSYFDHAIAWNKHMDEEGCLIITYEDLKENLVRGVQQIADFFQFSLSEEQIRFIAARATFDAMKARANETHGKIGQALFRKGITCASL